MNKADTALEPVKATKTETAETLNPQNKEALDITNFLQHANNPGVVFFTIFFKLLAVAR